MRKHDFSGCMDKVETSWLDSIGWAKRIGAFILSHCARRVKTHAADPAIIQVHKATKMTYRGCTLAVCMWVVSAGAGPTGALEVRFTKIADNDTVLPEFEGKRIGQFFNPAVGPDGTVVFGVRAGSSDKFRLMGREGDLTVLHKGFGWDDGASVDSWQFYLTQTVNGSEKASEKGDRHRRQTPQPLHVSCLPFPEQLGRIRPRC